MTGAPRRRLVALRAAVALALAAGAAGCASTGGRSPEEEQVTVRLSAPRSTAVRRTLDAMRAQGYRVRESLTSGTEMTTEPFRHGDDVEAVFRAAVSGSGGTSRIVLSGTYHRKQFGGIVRTSDEPVRRATEGVEGELWARLQNLGLAIRSAR
ncbi:MAG: hypothetical protein ACJ79S_20960 [Gemmatimonadaceae bacterium]